ncbi:MAG: hypothetical protein OXT69_05995 [Candidatus Poribacteria bacterium]|nr:hypothetical protein [Candidatus Poribacteria bacterium]
MNEKRASAKAIAVGSLVAFFGGCIASCILAMVIFGTSIGPNFQQWENLEDEAMLEALTAEIEESFSNPTVVILFIAAFGGFALLGGYISGRMGKEEPVLNGTWVGGIVGGILLLFTLLQFLLMLGAGDLSKALLNILMGLGQAAVVLLLARWGGQLGGGSGEET